MDTMKWELLVEIQGRLDADLLKSLLNAHEIEVELFQESIGVQAYPVTVDGLGKVQVFVRKEQIGQARQLLKEYQG